jgi:MFS family permease
MAMGLALGLAPAVAVAVVAFALFGVGEAVWNVVAVSLRQAAVPDRLFGRVNSAYRFVQWGSMPVGAALGGWLAGAYGLRAPWLVSAGALTVVTAFGWRHMSNRAVERARGTSPAQTSEMDEQPA